MNQEQRTEIQELREQLDGIRARIEEIQSDEQSKYDNIPENLQGSERGEKFQEGIDALGEILENLESADQSFDNLEE